MFRLVALISIALLSLAACGGTKSDEPVTSSSVEATVGDEVRGLAQNAKAGAVLLLPDGRVIYIFGLQMWPEEALNQQVVARGRLQPKKGMRDVGTSDDGTAAAGIGDAEAWDLRDPEWSVVE